MGDDLAPTRARLIRAVVLAPLAAPAAYAAGLLVVTLVASLGPGPGPVGRLLNIPLAVGAIGTPIAYGAMLAGVQSMHRDGR